MEKWEYTPIWYFTTQASMKVKGMIKMALDDSVFGFAKDSDGKVTLTTNPTMRASTKVKADEDLTWEEVLNAKSFFLKSLDLGDWPPLWR
ncbi:hypothetical protein PM082_015000 [Marasmius tenuissimus]|nr:hypothetical protein PM082_015000 [Marasmius tenuissimus]